MRKINFQTIDQSLNDIKIYQFLNKKNNNNNNNNML